MWHTSEVRFGPACNLCYSGSSSSQVLCSFFCATNAYPPCRFLQLDHNIQVRQFLPLSLWIHWGKEWRWTSTMAAIQWDWLQAKFAIPDTVIPCIVQETKASCMDCFKLSLFFRAWEVCWAVTERHSRWGVQEQRILAQCIEWTIWHQPLHDFDWWRPSLVTHSLKCVVQFDMKRKRYHKAIGALCRPHLLCYAW